ncbi:hypothetical protein [Actinomadura alba]|uniref:Minor tail protein n=1 Tax=Actinomadura alba TaxID=406431 RepID=A0ABR7LHC5_9ACTN|nr:hypothetical protein [Actinomadura alba]MBC6464251.1 hypothetical protein [Actinomadura alba]
MVNTWKFVERPESGAGVLLDMNNGSTWTTLKEGFDISPPPLRRSVATNSMRDGGLVTSANYELRELRFKLELAGASEDARAAQLKALYARLGEPGWLMFQATGATYPVFFQTLRSDDPRVNREWAPDAWLVECAVLAEPFALGVRHDIQTGVVIQNDPASGTNRAFYDLTGVRGDHPTPLFARVGTGFGAGATFHVAVRSKNNPAAVTTWAQCEAGTLGTDTTLQANDATMSGSGQNFVRTTFATNTFITRVTVTAPTASSPEAIKGRYRVLVKCRRSGSTSDFLMAYKLGGSSEVLGPRVTWSGGMPNVWLVDLGIVEFPSLGPSPTTIGYSGLVAGFIAPAIEIQAQRSTGALNLDMDYVYLLPADQRQLMFRQIGTPGYNVLDGPNDMVYGMASGTSPFGATRTVDNGGGLLSRDGGIPMLTPGETNRLHILRTPHDVTATSTWDFSYWPYWLEVATS